VGRGIARLDASKTRAGAETRQWRCQVSGGRKTRRGWCGWPYP